MQLHQVHPTPKALQPKLSFPTATCSLPTKPKASRKALPCELMKRGNSEDLWSAIRPCDPPTCPPSLWRGQCLKARNFWCHWMVDLKAFTSDSIDLTVSHWYMLKHEIQRGGLWMVMKHGGRKQVKSWTGSQTYHTSIQAHRLQHFGRGDGTASNEGTYLPVDLTISLWRYQVEWWTFSCMIWLSATLSIAKPI